jgi:hypothetical protein
VKSTTKCAERMTEKFLAKRETGSGRFLIAQPWLVVWWCVYTPKRASKSCLNAMIRLMIIIN